MLRRSKRNLITNDSNLETKETPRKDIGTVTDEASLDELKEDTSDLTQSPVFHIHIHVPECSKEKQTKMYLPRIQPVIHLHYDKLSQKLENEKELESRELDQRLLQKAVSEATPKFGNVLFHYQNASCGNEFDEQELITSTPQRVLRSRSKTNDSTTSRSFVSNVVHTENSISKSYAESTHITSKNNSLKSHPESTNKTNKHGSPKSNAESNNKTHKNSSSKSNAESASKTSKHGSPKSHAENNNKTHKNSSPKSHAESTNKASKNNSSRSNSESVKKSNRNSCRNRVDEDSKVESSNSEPAASPPIKLKKAVVMLEDITKLKLYQNYLKQKEENEALTSSQCSELNEITEPSPEIKQECESPTSRSSSSALSERLSKTGDEDCHNPNNSKSSHCEFSDEDEEAVKCRTLASLVEGCNFSEILKKFKGKDIQFISETLKNSKYLAVKKKNINEEIQEKVSESENTPPVKNVDQTQEQCTEDESHSEEIKEKEEKEECTLEMPTENNTETAEANKVDIKLDVNIPKQTSESLETRCLVVSRCETVQVFTKVIKVIESKNETQSSLPVTSEDDQEEKTTKSELSSSSDESFKSLKSDSEERDAVNCDDTKECDVVDTKNDLSSVNNEIRGFEPIVRNKFQEASMNNRSVNVKEKLDKKRHSLNSNSSFSSPAKKKIKSVEKVEKPKDGKAKRSFSDGYIPLNVSGPTKFAVACLPNVQAFKAHDAKNFKHNMLFGSRVQRFTDSNQLRILKMKKQAAGRR